jgi:hypothetical protein
MKHDEFNDKFNDDKSNDDPSNDDPFDDKSEQEFRDLFTRDVDVPLVFTHTITHFPQQNNSDNGKDKTMKINFRKKIILAATVCILVLCTTAAIAGDSILDFFSSFNDRGLNKAIEHEYIQNIDMEYVTFDGLGIKVDSILMDDQSLLLVLNYRFEHPDLLKDFDRLGLGSSDPDYDLLGKPNEFYIKDEQGNIFFQEGNPDSLRLIYGGSYAIKDNILKQAIALSSLEGSLPKSNQLFIGFSEVTIYNSQGALESFLGDWLFEIDVPDKFNQRDNINYTASENAGLKISSAVLTPTGLGIEMQFQSYMPPEIYELLLFHMKLTDSAGKEYSHHDTFNAGEVEENGQTKIYVNVRYQTSLYEAQDSYTLIVDIGSSPIVIELTADK